MEKRAYLRKELNLTQYEMSELLNITRSQLSLFELGLRELPTTALVRSSQIGIFMATTKAPETKDFPQNADWEKEKEVFLQKALKDCEYYQLGIIRKLPKMEEACQSALKLLQLIDYLKEQVNEEALHPGAISILKEKVQKSLDKNGPKELMKLKLQLQVLQAEEALLKNLIEGSGPEKQELE